ncbi:type I restriction enzyme subunit R domain-containing protein [Rickettsia conorii subsp. raoultii]
MITNGLNKEEKAALKTRFSRSKMLAQTKEAIYAKAFDISTHYLKTFKGMGLKGMLIAPSRLIAVRFKKILDDIGQVSSEVVISSTDDRDGYKDIERENEVDKFIKNMREQYGAKFNNRIIKKFKSSDDPEILIVVSKLLTGFDAPRNVVIYICKELKEHNLLQAIARANRLFEEKGKTKEYGYIIDYVGLSNQLKQAHQFYENYGLNNFDREDLEDAIFFVDDKLKALFPLLQEINNIFINVPNDLDSEQLEQHLADEAIRSFISC